MVKLAAPGRSGSGWVVGAPACVGTSPLMRVVLGPVPSSSALAWIDHARRVLDRLAAEDPPTVPPDALAEFEAYLREWEAVARTDPEFRWRAEVDPEVVEYLLNAFHRIATRLDAETGDRPRMPPEAEPFYRMLVVDLLDELARVDESRAEFAEHLLRFWPGIGDEHGRP